MSENSRNTIYNVLNSDVCCYVCWGMAPFNPRIHTSPPRRIRLESISPHAAERIEWNGKIPSYVLVEMDQTPRRGEVVCAFANAPHNWNHIQLPRLTTPNAERTFGKMIKLVIALNWGTSRGQCSPVPTRCVYWTNHQTLNEIPNKMGPRQTQSVS